MYSLYLNVQPNGWGPLKKLVFSSDNLGQVKEKLRSEALSGVKVKDLSIVKEIPFEFKCAVVVKDEEET